LFCGLGGWSDGFAEEGFNVVGVELNPKIAKRYKHPCIIADVQTLDGKRFQDFDVIVGSPPCSHFSNMRYRNKYAPKPTPEKGLPLIEAFWRIVEEAQPRFYAMENIKALTKYYDRKPQWHFMISKGGKRCLWTNIPLPLTTQFRFRHKIRDIHGWDKTRPLRAYIPHQISTTLAKAVKEAN